MRLKAKQELEYEVLQSRMLFGKILEVMGVVSKSEMSETSQVGWT